MPLFILLSVVEIRRQSVGSPSSSGVEWLAERKKTLFCF